MKWFISNILNKKILLLIIAIAATFFLFTEVLGLINDKSEQPISQQGTLDLSGWNPSRTEIISLNGKWEFYWQRLLTYNDLQHKYLKPDLMAEVPKVWNGYNINGKSLSGFGYATYRLRIINAQEGQEFAIRMPTVSTAYKLYINDKLIASNGKVGIDKQHFIPEYRPVLAEFTPTSKDFNIILQAANFSYARGGVWYPIFIGFAEKVTDYDKTIGYKDMFLLGAFLIMAFYYSSIFLMRKGDRGSLYFVLLCFITIGRTVIYGDYVINRMLPSNGYSVIVAIDYVTLLWFPVMLVLLIGELFAEQVSCKLKRLFILYAVFMSLFVMLSPIYVYTSFTYPLEAVALAMVTYAIVCDIRAFSGAKADSAIIFVGALAVLLGGIHDVLYQNNIISSGLGELSSFGFLIMLFLQAYILARRIKESVETAITSELKFLQAQIKPHFLYNAINTFVSISRYDMEQARRLMIDFSSYLRRSFDFKGLGQVVPLRHEIELVKAYLDIEKAQYEERLEVSFEVCDDKDVKVPILVLQPVIENAILHGVLPKKEGGCIEVLIKKEEKMMVFTVKDNGVGIEQEKVENILKHESRSGVGLSNIDSRLKKLYGRGLQINSKPGIGTEITWCVPVNINESV